MSTTTLKSYSIYIHTIIMFVLMIGIGFLPTFGQVTELGMKILGIFVGTLYGWLFIDLLWPSLLGLVGLGLTGVMTIDEAFSSALSNSTGIQVIITCVFAGALTKIGAVDVVSNWMLTRKSLQKNPWMLIIALFLTVIVGTLLGAGIALVFMIWVLVQKAADKCGYKRTDPLVGFIMVMAVILCFTASQVLPFRGAALMFLAFFTPTAGAMPYVPYMLFMLVYVVLFVLGMMLVAKFVIKINVDGFRLPDEEIARIQAQKVTTAQKIGCVIMIGFIVCMFLPTLLPDSWGVTQFFATMGLLGVSTIALMLMALVRDENGNRIVKLADCHSSVPWDIVWLICATMPLANAMESEDSGIMATIVGALQPVLSTMSPFVLMMAAMIFLGLLTQVTHNLVLGALFIPFLTELGLSMDANVYTFFMILIITLNCAYVTPAASMQSALIHGNADIGPKMAYTWGIAALVISWIILAIISVPLGNLLF